MSHPQPVPLFLSCPACQSTLVDDADGTRCAACDGVLVARTWALRPDLGRPALQPAFIADDRKRYCPACRRTMGPVLCHGVLAWSCARCRWLFFEGAKQKSPTGTRAREMEKPNLVSVLVDGARSTPTHVRDALGVIVLVALVVAAMFLELRP